MHTHVQEPWAAKGHVAASTTRVLAVRATAARLRAACMQITCYSAIATKPLASRGTQCWYTLARGIVDARAAALQP